jgi:coproporphyrinogen III oxidase
MVIKLYNWNQIKYFLKKGKWKTILHLHKTLQDQIVAGLEAVDGQAKFKEIYENAQKAAADAHA